MIMSNLELKEIRNKMKLSQTEFARLFEKTSMRTVQNWEGGVTPVPEYAKLVIEKELNKGLKSIVLTNDSDLLRQISDLKGMLEFKDKQIAFFEKQVAFYETNCSCSQKKHTA